MNDQDLADVYLTVAVRTSEGAGPGHKRLPVAEAARLVAMRHAAYGSEAPTGFLDGAVPPVYAAMMPRTVTGT